MEILGESVVAKAPLLVSLKSIAKMTELNNEIDLYRRDACRLFTHHFTSVVGHSIYSRDTNNSKNSTENKG